MYSVSGSWTEEVNSIRDDFDSSLTLRGGDDDEPEIPQRQRREDRSRYSSSNPAPLFSGRLRSGLSWRAFEAKTVLPNSVVGKASTPMFTTVGPRSSNKQSWRYDLRGHNSIGYLAESVDASCTNGHLSLEYKFRIGQEMF